MQKDSKKILRIRPIVIIMWLGVVSFIGIMVYDHMRHERENRTTDIYADYICKDYHLVCMNMDERAGSYSKEGNPGTYYFRYGTLEGISDKEFIYAYIAHVFLGDDRNLILQHPNNEINILSDWNIEKVCIYYVDHNDWRNPDAFDMATGEDYVIYEIASSDNEDIIQEIKLLSLNKEPELDYIENIQSDAYAYYIDSQRYQEAIKDNIELCIRVFFQESDSIVWDSEIQIFNAEEDPNNFLVTINGGCMDKMYERKDGDVRIDSDSQLYQFIWDAYMNSDISSSK